MSLALRLSDYHTDYACYLCSTATSGFASAESHLLLGEQTIKLTAVVFGTLGWLR